MTSRSGSPRKGEAPALAAERVEVGRIGRAHGVRGEVAVDVSSDVPDRFRPGARLIAAPAGRDPFPLEIETQRPHKGGLLVRFAGIADRDAAEALRGLSLEVPRAEVPAAPAEQFYFFELVGLACHDTTHGHLGRVEDVVEDGGGVLLRVRDGERELLVPFVETMVTAVDLAGGRLDLMLPEGLVETCGSG
jgi:16S rRNA processing protein RimM